MISHDITWHYMQKLKKINYVLSSKSTFDQRNGQKSSAIMAFSRSFVDSETFFQKYVKMLMKSCKKSKKMTDVSWMRHSKDQIKIRGYQSSSFFQLIADLVSKIYITRPNGELWRIWIFQKICIFFNMFPFWGLYFPFWEAL